MARIRSIVVVAAALAAAGLGPRSAAAERWEVSLSSSVRLLRSPSVDPFSDSDLRDFVEVQAAGAIGDWRGAGLKLMVDATYQVGTLDGVAFGLLDTEATLHGGELGLRGIRPLSSRVSAYGRVGLGLAKISVSMRDTSRSITSLSDGGWTPTGFVGGGLAVDLARLRRSETTTLAFGLRFEAGRSLMRPIALEANAESLGGDDVIHIPAQTASLGELDLSGWTVRVALAFRF